jgi:hypothetical protein
MLFRSAIVRSSRNEELDVLGEAGVEGLHVLQLRLWLRKSRGWQGEKLLIHSPRLDNDTDNLEPDTLSAATHRPSLSILNKGQVSYKLVDWAMWR